MVAKFVDYLNGAIKAIPTFAEEPVNPLEEYYVVEQTGGEFEDFVERIVVTVQSYGRTMENAIENDRTMRNEIMSGLILDNDISDIELVSYYDYTDTTKKKYRYQAVFEVIPF